MKTRIFILTLLIALKAYSQDKEHNEYRTIIDSAIDILIENTYQKINEKDFNNNLVIFIVDENLKQLNLDNIKSKNLLKTIDVKDKKNIKLLRKGIKIWQVKPVLRGNIITVNVIYFMVSYKNKMYEFVNSGGASFTFEYFCEEERWITTEVKYNSF